MKTVYLLVFQILIIMNGLQAQSYFATGNPIPDHGSPLQVPIVVAGLDSTNLTVNYGLETVCINIQHTACRDLAVYLMSPTGMTIELTSGNGGFGDNYTSTCFDMSAIQLISARTAPFTGNFVPEHSIGSFNNGQIGNGVWRLIVTDYVAGDTGAVIDVTLYFGYSPAPPLSVSVGPCDDYSPAGCQCAGGDSSCLLMPDILTATSMLQDTFWQRETFNTLKVTNSCANIGFGPMEIIGTGIWMCGDTIVSGPGLCPSGQYAKQQVKQRIYIKQAGLGYFDFKDTLVGTMQFHSDLGHNHLHVDDWAINTLRLRGPEADASLWPIIGRGNKVSFCIYDHLICAGTFNNCQYGPDLNIYSTLVNNGLGTGFSTCGNSVQGLSVGYSDVYDWSLDGQEISFDSICNGNYFIVTEFDPDNRFVDGDRSNNVSVVPVKLKNQLANCCHTDYRIDTINADQNIYQFVDLTMPIPDQWLWNFGDGRTDTSQFPIVDFNDSMILNISLLTSNHSGCSDSANRWILVGRDIDDTCRANFGFEFIPSDWFSYFTIIGDTSIIDSIQVIFYDSSTLLVNVQRGSFTLANNSFGHPYFIQDSMQIIIHYNNSCTFEIDTVYYILIEGIEETSIDYKVSVAPNPARNESYFGYELANPTNVTLLLYDATGKLVETLVEETIQNTGIYRYKIPLPNSGFYLLRAKFGLSEHIEKIFSY